MSPIMEGALQRATSGCAHLIFRGWPLSYGLERLMGSLDPSPPAGLVTRKLRGFPLRLTFDPRSYLGRFLYYRGMYEDATMRVLRRVLRRGMGFLDIGANLGLHTTIAAYLVGESGRVLAVEPQEDMCELIRLNASQNGLSNISIVQTAVGRVAGDATLHQLYDGNPAAATLRIGPSESSRSTASVPVRTLSDVVAGAGFGARDLVVKIDVEGAELEVLSGADECLSECPPSVILVECMDHHLRRFGASSVDLLGTLDALGYRLSSLHHGRRIDLEPSRPVNADVVAWRPDQFPW